MWKSPQLYLESRARLAASGDQPSFFEIFRKPLLRVTVLGSLMGTGAQGGYFAVTTWLPTFLRTERKLSVLDSAGYLSVSIAGAFFGYLSGGYLADRIGRRFTFLVFAVGAGVVAITYTMLRFGNSAMLVLGFPLGFFSSGVFSAMGPFFTEHFPTRVRGVGQGFAYNAGRATGAFSRHSWVFSPRKYHWDRPSAYLRRWPMGQWLWLRSCCRKRAERSWSREPPKTVWSSNWDESMGKTKVSE